MALGRVVLPRRAIAASTARERGRKQGTVPVLVCVKSLEKLILDLFFVVDHDHDLKNRCFPGRFEKLRLLIFH